jgi:hypothetical protein
MKAAMFRTRTHGKRWMSKFNQTVCGVGGSLISGRAEIDP